MNFYISEILKIFHNTKYTILRQLKLHSTKTTKTVIYNILEC